MLNMFKNKNLIAGLIVGPIKLFFLTVIYIYQKFISKLFLPRCRFYPSCSEYAKIAILRYPLCFALWLISKRLLRCHPRSCGGIDELPSKYDKKL